MATFSSERRQDELLEFSDHSSGDDNTSVVVKICAQEVVDFSSQYGGETRLSYSAVNLAGKPNIYPNYGDFTQACVFVSHLLLWRLSTFYKPVLSISPSALLGVGWFGCKILPPRDREG